jgi:hypothetical protein
MAIYVSYIIDLFSKFYNYFYNPIPIYINKNIYNKNINIKYVSLDSNHISISNFIENNNIIYGYDTMNNNCFFMSLLFIDENNKSDEISPYIMTLYDIPNNTIIYSNYSIFNEIEISEKIKIFYNLINVLEYEITYLDDQKDIIKHKTLKLYDNNNDNDEYILL